MTHMHRSGPVDAMFKIPVKKTGAVPTSTIQVGSNVALVSNALVVDTAFTFTTDEATTQTNFAAAYAGNSASRSVAASTDPRELHCEVHMDGNIEMDAVSAVYRAGDLVGVATGGSAVLTTVKASVTKARSIGVVVDDDTAARTRILVRIINTPIKR